MRAGSWLLRLLILLLGLVGHMSHSPAHQLLKNKPSTHRGPLHWELTSEATVTVPFDGYRVLYPEVAIGPEAFLEISSRVLWRLSMDAVVQFAERTTLGVMVFTSLEVLVHKHILLGVAGDSTLYITPISKWEASLGPLLRLRLDNTPQRPGIKSIGLLFAVAHEEELGHSTSERVMDSSAGQHPLLKNWQGKITLQFGWVL